MMTTSFKEKVLKIRWHQPHDANQRGNMFFVEHKEIGTGRSNTVTINRYDAGSLTLPDVDENKQQSLTFYHQLQGLRRAGHYKRFIPKGKLFILTFKTYFGSVNKNIIE